MMTRFFDSLAGVKIGWLATIGGASVSAATAALPDALSVEVWLKELVLLLTALSLALTVALQMRALRRGTKE